jgi:hypothetical protein
MQDITLNKNNRLFRFDSMTEVVEFCNPKDYEDAGKGFMGEDLPSWDHVMKRSSRVWAEGMFTLNQFLDRLRKVEIPEIKSRKRKTQFSEHGGDEIDLDRLYAGQPYWRESKSEAVTGPTTITVIIDTSTSSSVDAKNILWRGAAALALTEILEEKGYSVEIWVIAGETSWSGCQTAIYKACRLKCCSDPLDCSTLINSVSGWFYRSATFTLMKSIATHCKKTARHSLGSPCTATQDDIDHLTTDQNRVYSSGVYTFDGACDLMVAELTRIAEQGEE